MLGVSNKNLGEAFVFVWKFPSKFINEDENGNFSVLKSFEIKQLSDIALIAFVKIVASLNLSTKMLDYR